VQHAQRRRQRASDGADVAAEAGCCSTEVFGRVGWARTSVDLSGVDTKSNDLAYGLGVKYNFTPRMNVGLDYTRYADKSGVKVGGVTLGMGYHF
jgi:outer membrane autotransporter protein